MYSQAKVIAGGLAHIPVVIGVFSFIQKFFSKRASNFPQDTEVKKSPVKPVEQKSAPKPAPVAKAETKAVVKKNMQMFQSIFTVLKRHTREQSLKITVFSKKEQLVELIT